jgi:hypothetical protein
MALAALRKSRPVSIGPDIIREQVTAASQRAQADPARTGACACLGDDAAARNFQKVA